MSDQFFENGWTTFPYDPVLAAWGEHALPAARDAVVSPEFPDMHRCGGTWFAGVHALPNDARGAPPGGPPISGVAVTFIEETLGLSGFAWDRAQISVCYPGYPQPWEKESEAAFRYRRDRCAAHLDGLLPEGPDRRRHLREHHGFILGVPLAEADQDAAPFVIWEGSHERVRAAFRDLFSNVEPTQRGEIDVTEPYHALRREIFETCPMKSIVRRPGEAFLVHRLALHGVAPWRDGAKAGPDGRMIAYFRPSIGDAEFWLESA